MLRRKGLFTTRVCIPAELQDLIGRRELWRSTQTGDPREARLREALWRHHFEALFLQLRRSAGTMAQAQLSALVTEYLEARLEEVEERLAFSLRGASEKDRDAWVDSIAEQLQGIEVQLMHGDYSQTESEARRLLPDAGEIGQAILARRLLEAKFDALRAELAALHGKPMRRAQIVAKVAAQEEPQVTPKATPRISELCRDYIKTTGTAQSWSGKTLASREQASHLLIDFLNDMPVGEVTRQHMTDAYLLLPRMPSHFSKRYPKLTPRGTIEAADKKNDQDRYSPKSCNLRLEVWRSLFRYAVQNDVIAKSPADHLKAFAEGKAQDARDAFTDEQLKAFFGLLKAEREERPEHYWIARVMAYTGLRLEEASALRPCDLQKVDDVWCIEVSPEASNIKTENAARLVPLHSALAEDLRAYTANQKGEREGNFWGLEQDRSGKWSAALSKRMNKRLAKALPGKSRKLVVESLRNTFATRLKQADVQEHVISELMGHVINSLAVGRYGKKLVPSRLREQVEKLNLPSLDP